MDFQIVIAALTKIVTDIIDFIPRLIYGTIILLIGTLVALLVRAVLRFVLRRLHFDPLVERTGITGTLRGLGIKTPLSDIVAQTIFALLLLSFLITAARLMGLDPVARVLEQLLIFLPNLIAAVIVFLVGGIVAKFLGDLVAGVVGGAGLTYASRIGSLVQYLISLFVVILALSTMGLDTSILVTAVTILLAAFGLALALALGFGARTVVQHILAGYYMRQRFTVGQLLTLDQTRGAVSNIGTVNTVVTTPTGDVVIPNRLLAESIVESPRPPAAPPVAPPVTPPSAPPPAASSPPPAPTT
jgi:small-conductance mechanosensitive channel